MPPLRVYAETSVIGGCFDHQFQVASVRLFDLIRRGRFLLLLSRLTLDELQAAPAHVRGVIANLPEAVIRRVPFDAEMVRLRDASNTVTRTAATPVDSILRP